ncbi:MAG: DUF996 domain-containing protein [Aquificae bacterium]|nr:DUF996 domain-containing protein [Aquificota bacterium]
MSKQTKQLGGIGLILVLVGNLLGAVIPFAGLLTLIGWVLAVVAYIKAGDEYGEPAIKGNAIKAVILWIVSVIVFVLGGGALIASVAAGFGGSEEIGTGLGGAGLLILVVAWILALVASWFWYKANVFMSQKSQVGLFKTGGLLMFIGTILMIILIGGLISLVGQILLIVAFFSVSEKTTDTQLAQS